MTMASERPDQDFAELFGSPPGDDELAALYTRLAVRAEEEGLLDLAYRTLDTLVGTLLLAATPTGLVRVAYEREGLDTVLGQLAVRVSPRILQAPRRLDEVARQLEEYFTGQRTQFRPAPRPSAFGRLPPLGVELSAGRWVMGRRPATSQWLPQCTTRRPCGPSAPPAPPTLCRWSSPVIGLSALTGSSVPTSVVPTSSISCSTWRHTDDRQCHRDSIGVPATG